MCTRVVFLKSYSKGTFNTIKTNKTCSSYPGCLKFYQVIRDENIQVQEHIRKGELTSTLDTERRLVFLYRFHYSTVRVLIQSNIFRGRIIVRGS